MMPQRLIYTIKDLRNAIAHNDVVFDTRFQTGEINKQVGHAISNVTGINHLTFRTITDYLILVIYQLKLLHVSKSEMKRIISRFEYIVEKLRSNIPINIFHQIIYTDNRSKIILLKNLFQSKKLAFYLYFLYIISVNCGTFLRSVLRRIGCVRFSFLLVFPLNH